MLQIPIKTDFKPVNGSVEITSIDAGSSFDVEVTLNGTTTSALDVTLSVPTGSPVTLPSPATLTVPANSDTGRVTVSTSPVSGNTSVTITASANGGDASAAIMVLAGIDP